MPKLILTPILLILFFNAFTQSISIDVISSSGDKYGKPKDNVSLTWTLGEGVVETFTKQEGSISSGFHQYYPVKKSIKINQNNSILSLEELEQNIKISAYPNPTFDYLTIDIDYVNEVDLLMEIYDLRGKLFKRINLKESSEEINLSELRNGTYILQIFTSDQLIQILKIEKID